MRELIRALLCTKSLTRRKAERLKREWAAKARVARIPLNSEILAACTKAERQQLEPILRTKPTRTISGVSVVAIMAKPATCPGQCVYCFRGAEAPQSYTGYEPAALRARLNEYDPYAQVQNRLKQLQAVSHPTDKNELIIMGGTFPALTFSYQREFVKRAFDAFNGKEAKSLEEAQKLNERAKNRVIGLTIETRGDYVNPDQLLTLGCTRVELGVQTVFDDILKKINRGYPTELTVLATQKLKETSFKVLYHLMPGLPGSSFKRDLQTFETIFSDPRFKPDMLKIYPTLVIKGTQLYEWWKAERYHPIDEKYMQRLLLEIYKIVPKWVRIMRVQRDVPSQFIEAGPRKSNLREIIEKKLEHGGIRSKEIRFREAGHVFLRSGRVPEKIEILVEKYSASGGTEYFISAEDVDQDILVGFCRLRLPFRTDLRPEINENTALIRELHVYGPMAPLAKKAKWQHRGLGSKLLKKAEEIAKKEGKSEMIIISGVGVRQYYEKKDYELKGPYMWKVL